MEKRKYWFAGASILVAAALMLIAEFNPLSGLGLALTLLGAVEFLFFRNTLDGFIVSEVYGEAGESIWEFRSFVMMVGGPFLILSVILFG